MGIKSAALSLGHYLFRNRLVTRATSNRLSQMGLYLLILELEYLQGIGAGAGVATSGERGLATLLSDPAREYTIFDVGANVGEFTATLYPMVEDATFHLFEPQRAARREIPARYRHSPDTVLNDIALADAPGEQTLYYDAEGSTLASLTKRRRDHSGPGDAFDGAETVETTTVDRYCARNEVDRIDLLKLDVEGHELDVLRGAEAMIAAGAVDNVSFEFGGANVDTRTYLRDYFDFFTGHDYTLYRILPGGKFFELDRYRELDEKFRTSNYVAVRADA